MTTDEEHDFRASIIAAQDTQISILTATLNDYIARHDAAVRQLEHCRECCAQLQRRIDALGRTPRTTKKDTSQ